VPGFRSPQTVLLVEDPEASAAFYSRLGFTEKFRTPASGPPIHIDVALDGMRLGLAARRSVEEDHGLSAATGPGRAAVVVWTDDVRADVAALEGEGVPVLRPPAPWLGRLRIAWLSDPDGHLVQLVQHTERG
jgi:catechol 2,3-dioxygenase-like lactoylglutathione lyase family enzyme